MACKKPLTAWRSNLYNSNGKNPLTFKEDEGIGEKIFLSCGNCIGCRLERSRQWAIRCVHEASLHKVNSYITLTYNDENLPENSSLVLEDITLFFKRLRKNTGQKIRYFQCGEYGEKRKRPHHHAALFGYCPTDLVHYKTMHGGFPLYKSDFLAKTWGKGFVTVGTLTFQSAAYVARYITKKINGELADEKYDQIDYETGEVHTLKKEYCTMSRRPGIGHDWYQKYNTDVTSQDSVIIRGRQMPPPKYYDYLLSLNEPIKYMDTKLKREEKRYSYPETNQKRLNTELECLERNNKLLIRKLEQEI